NWRVVFAGLTVQASSTPRPSTTSHSGLNAFPLLCELCVSALKSAHPGKHPIFNHFPLDPPRPSATLNLPFRFVDRPAVSFLSAEEVPLDISERRHLKRH